MPILRERSRSHVALGDYQAELIDTPSHVDKIGLQPAERKRLAQLCSEEGAITKQEEQRLHAEATELEERVQSLLPAATDGTLQVGKCRESRKAALLSTDDCDP